MTTKVKGRVIKKDEASPGSGDASGSNLSNIITYINAHFGAFRSGCGTSRRDTIYFTFA